MKNIKIFAFVIGLSLIISLGFSGTVHGFVPDLTFPEDTVQLYENGVQVTDSNTITTGGECIKGTCIIDQQSYPITIYRVKSDSVLTYPEFSLQHPYQGDQHDGQAIDQWNKEDKIKYFEYLKQNTLYSAVFNPKQSADDRLFDLDLKTGEYKEKITPKTIRNIIVFIAIGAVIVAVLYLVVVLVKRSIKK